MFERFTHQARHTVVIANLAASTLGHAEVRPEHLLLAILYEEDTAGFGIVDGLGVDPADARRQVVLTLGRGDADRGPRPPFTAEAKQVFLQALREALALGHQHIGTEHLLCGVLSSAEGAAAQVLVDHGISLERSRMAAGKVPPGAEATPDPRGQSADNTPGRYDEQQLAVVDLMIRIDVEESMADLIALARRIPAMARVPGIRPECLAVMAIWRLAPGLLPAAEFASLPEPPEVLGALADLADRLPRDIDARAATALARIFQGRYRDARILVNERFAAKQLPSVRARTLAVCSLLKTVDGDRATARRLFGEAADLRPNQFLLPYLRGRLARPDGGATGVTRGEPR